MRTKTFKLLAIVEDIIVEKVGNIRVVKLFSKSNIMIRPILKVHPLEVQEASSLPKQSLSKKKEAQEYYELKLPQVLKISQTKCGGKVNKD